MSASFRGPDWKNVSEGGIGRPKASTFGLTHEERRMFRTKVDSRTLRRIREEKGRGGCRICGKHPVTLHHVVKRSQGGDDIRPNLVPLCGDGTTGCHGLVEARDPETLQLLAEALTNSEYSYVVGKLGENAMERLFGVLRDPETAA